MQKKKVIQLYEEKDNIVEIFIEVLHRSSHSTMKLKRLAAAVIPSGGSKAFTFIVFIGWKEK